MPDEETLRRERLGTRNNIESKARLADKETSGRAGQRRGGASVPKGGAPAEGIAQPPEAQSREKGLSKPERMAAQRAEVYTIFSSAFPMPEGKTISASIMNGNDVVALRMRSILRENKIPLGDVCAKFIPPITIGRVKTYLSGRVCPTPEFAAQFVHAVQRCIAEKEAGAGYTRSR